MLTEPQRLQTAKAQVDLIATAGNLAAHPVMATRARHLIDHPDDTYQGMFGICAMTTAVRSLPQHDRAKFIALMQTVFAGIPFRGVVPPATL